MVCCDLGTDIQNKIPTLVSGKVLSAKNTPDELIRVDFVGII